MSRSKYDARVLLVAPTALDYQNKPIKTKKLYLPGLTMPMLAAVTPDNIELVCVSETIQEIPYDDCIQAYSNARLLQNQLFVAQMLRMDCDLDSIDPCKSTGV